VITWQSVATAVSRLAALPFDHSPPNRSGNSYAVTLVTPIQPGKTDDLRQLLRGFRQGKGSPLATVPEIQFARWVVIDKLRTDWPHAPRRPSKLHSDYLLFSADLTTSPDRAAELPGTFFRNLAAIKDCAEVWGKCLRFPASGKAEDFVDYLTRSEIEIGLYYAAFPNVTAREIKNAIEFRDKFTRFVCDHEEAILLPRWSPAAGRAHQKLKDDYLAQFTPRP